MRAVTRLAFPALIALLMTACGEKPAAPAAPPMAAPSALSAPEAGSGTALGTDALRERAAASLAANRLYAPAATRSRTI